MLCPYCRSENKQGAVKCAACGSWITDYPPVREWYRPRSGRMIAGVCRGLADRFGLPVAAVRLGFLLALLLGAMSLIVYVACWIAMPNAPEPPLPTTAAVPPSPSPDGGGGQAA